MLGFVAVRSIWGDDAARLEPELQRNSTKWDAKIQISRLKTLTLMCEKTFPTLRVADGQICVCGKFWEKKKKFLHFVYPKREKFSIYKRKFRQSSIQRENFLVISHALEMRKSSLSFSTVLSSELARLNYKYIFLALITLVEILWETCGGLDCFDATRLDFGPLHDALTGLPATAAVIIDFYCSSVEIHMRKDNCQRVRNF